MEDPVFDQGWGTAVDAADPEALADEFLRLASGSRLATLRRWRDAGLSIDQLVLLGALRANGPLTISAIAHARGVSLPNATSIVARLESRGYVERVRNNTDRRQVEVELTALGAETATEFEVVRRTYLVRIFSEMSLEDREALVRVARSFLAAVDRLRVEPVAGPPETPVMSVPSQGESRW